MCKLYEHCSSCPIGAKELYCPAWGDDLEKIDDIVEKWSKENPVKTRQSEFFKIFPKARMRNDVVNICPCKVDKDFLQVDGCENASCYECQKEYWSEVIE